MVEVHFSNGKVDCAELYTKLSATEAESGWMNVDGDDDIGIQIEVYEDVFDQKCKYEIAQKRWTSLYDSKGAEKLKEAMMRYL